MSEPRLQALALANEVRCARAQLKRDLLAGRVGMERPINDGDPISRAEAERLAEVGEYTLDTKAQSPAGETRHDV
jgi:hypothetical protein